MKFDIAYKFTEKWEGGLSDVPQDKGGITNFGISLVFLSDYARRKRKFLDELGIGAVITKDTIRQLTKLQAREIIRDEFWNDLNLAPFHPRLATVLFDCAFNSGPARSFKLAQQAWNQLNPHQTKLKVDGIPGPLTRKALLQINETLPFQCIALRENFLGSICKKNPSQQVFLKGWLNRTTDLRCYIASL